MVTTSKPLLMLTAGDLMSRDVVVVPQEMSLRAAAHLLARASISGAPVVDAKGRCVGVLSATDFVRWADKPPAVPRRLAVCVPMFAEWEIMDVDLLPEDQVRAFMTADPVTVPPSADIGTLARHMMNAHIHRVIVVDEDKLPIGVVSSIDILSAVAYADRMEGVTSLKTQQVAAPALR
jgi:CBS-domain-containing membrane protein